MSFKLNPFTGKLDDVGSSQSSNDLESVLSNGNTSGTNDIVFDQGYGITFNNYSRLREGTTDAMNGGYKGIAQICAVGYELKWEAGRLYVMDGNGVYIRWSLYNFTNTPSVNDDINLGFYAGSRWSLDDGSTYVCTDSSSGAAIWVRDNYAGIPVEIQAAASDQITALSVGTNKVVFRSTCNFRLSEIRASLKTAQNSGSLLTIDVNANGSSVLGTKITIDNGEKTSVSATTPSVLSTAIINDNDEITVDIDQIGDGTAVGLNIQLIGNRI